MDEDRLLRLWKRSCWLWIVFIGGKCSYRKKSQLQQHILEHTIANLPDGSVEKRAALSAFREGAFRTKRTDEILATCSET